jgi:hypothetical protein
MNFRTNGQLQDLIFSLKETTDFLEDTLWNLKIKVEYLELEIENLKRAMAERCKG